MRFINQIQFEGKTADIHFKKGVDFKTARLTSFKNKATLFVIRKKPFWKLIMRMFK